MATNVSPDRHEFRRRAREHPEARLIRSTTLDRRPDKADAHKCAMVIMPDGFYVEGGLRLPSGLIAAVRHATGVESNLPTLFVDERWFEFKRLKGSFNGFERITVDSKDWSVVETSVEMRGAHVDIEALEEQEAKL